MSKPSAKRKKGRMDTVLQRKLNRLHRPKAMTLNRGTITKGTTLGAMLYEVLGLSGSVVRIEIIADANQEDAVVLTRQVIRKGTAEQLQDLFRAYKLVLKEEITGDDATTNIEPAETVVEKEDGTEVPQREDL